MGKFLRNEGVLVNGGIKIKKITFNAFLSILSSLDGR